MVGLFGRALADELVRESLRRSEDNLDGRHPVLLFEGGPGSGKTEYLNGLVAELDGRLPHAHVDLEVFGDRRGLPAIPPLLAELAFQLGEYCEQYGELRFPRLVVGYVVMSVALDRTNRDVARRQVNRALRAHRGVDAVTAFLKDAAQGALAHVPGPITPSAGLVGRVLDLSVDALTSRSPLRRYILGPYQLWYGSQDGRPASRTNKARAKRSLNVLIRLSRWAHDGDPNDQKSINDLLWKAFLADLRDNFDHGQHSDEWPCNAVVLLDNADSPLGRAFLAELVQRRWLGDRDPLTIVVAGGAGLAAALGDDPVVPLIHDVGEKPTDGAPLLSWVRYRLRDLRAEDVVAMLGERKFSDADAALWADQLHQFTRGHPATTRLLVDAIPANPATRGDLASVLTAPHDGRAVEDELRHILLKSPPDDVLEYLAVCAAARSRADGDLLAGHTDLVGLNRMDLPAGMWLPNRMAEPTLLRRLLLRHLAARHPKKWTAAHEWLRQRSDRRDDDPEGRLYYRLACGSLEDSAHLLADQVKTTPIADWLTLATAVCWAPRPGSDQDAAQLNPEAAARVLLQGIDPGEQPFGTVSKVVARLWIAADPLCGHDRGPLYRQLVGALRALSELDYVHDETGELAATIKRYQDKAALYSPRLCTSSAPATAPVRRITGNDQGES